MSGPAPEAFDFTATGTITEFVVPQTGTYYIAAYGAEGGSYNPNLYYFDPFPPADANPLNGGLGGVAGGNFYLSQGQTLEIAVGEQGTEGLHSQDAALPTLQPEQDGGGGGSFVVLDNAGSITPLVVAGGGGGGYGYDFGGGAGGEGAAGDGSGSTVVGGGAGFFSNGAGTSTTTITESNGFGPIITTTAAGGADFANGLAGGGGVSDSFPGLHDMLTTTGSGGFGGGGGEGGGGGYTGGDPGEGGTSYISSVAGDPIEIAGVQQGNGYVEITYPACFAQGTRIATPNGPAPVETLRAGDLVISHRRSVPVRVRWVGHRNISCARVPNPAKVYPVRVRAGAFGRALPARDLFLSPDHAVFVEGALIPVRVLVNGHNVAQRSVTQVTYWHIQVDEHDVILAEGLPVESYLDAGGRSAFIGGPVTALAPDLATRVWEAQGCAPLRVTGPEVDTVRVRLEARREARRAVRAA